MKRAGFTMIELIFVIVILGILAAVAVPKLAGTRDDARITQLADSVGAVIKDLGAHYTAQDSMGTNWYDMTNVALETAAGTAATATTARGTQTMLTDGTNICITFDATADGNLTVGAGGGAATGNVCPTVNTMVASMIKIHQLGGTQISR